jgi:hypothetical protein
MILSKNTPTSLGPDFIRYSFYVVIGIFAFLIINFLIILGFLHLDNEHLLPKNFNVSILSSISDNLNVVVGLPIAILGTVFAITIANQAFRISANDSIRSIENSLREDTDIVAQRFTTIAHTLNRLYYITNKMTALILDVRTQRSIESRQASDETHERRISEECPVHGTNVPGDFVEDYCRCPFILTEYKDFFTEAERHYWDYLVTNHRVMAENLFTELGHCQNLNLLHSIFKHDNDLAELVKLSFDYEYRMTQFSLSSNILNILSKACETDKKIEIYDDLEMNVVDQQDFAFHLLSYLLFGHDTIKIYKFTKADVLKLTNISKSYEDNLYIEEAIRPDSSAFIEHELFNKGLLLQRLIQTVPTSKDIILSASDHLSGDDFVKKVVEKFNFNLSPKLILEDDLQEMSNKALSVPESGYLRQ